MENYDLTAIRGEYQILTVVTAGDWTAYNNVFTIKQNKDTSTERNTDTDSITSVYDSGTKKTTFSITLLPSDTSTISQERYYYDIQSTNPNDSTDVHTPVSGKIRFSLDVRTPTDGTTITTTNQTVTELRGSDFAAGDSIVSDGTDMVGQSVAERKAALGIADFLGSYTQAEIDALDTSSYTSGNFVVNKTIPTIQIWDGTQWV